MLKANSLVVLSQHVRSLLVHQDLVGRPNSANTNDDTVDRGLALDEVEEYVPQSTPALNALSAGHGSGF